MNYRHDFHAGNFSDVFKHIVLARLIEHLKRKDKAFRVIDTHGGSGHYELAAPGERDHRGKAPEWVSGIGRLADWQPDKAVAELLRPYLEAVFGERKVGDLATYPGSPLITMKLLRKQDRLTACELLPEAAGRLKQLFAGNFQARIIELDGWLVAGSQLPPKEKRGLMLIDPPFEKPAEFNRMLDSFEKAQKRWHGGTVAGWYPLKHDGDVRLFKRLVKEAGISDMVAHEFAIDTPASPPKLYGCGMIIRHPPHTLAQELQAIMPPLVRLLEARKGGGLWRIERITEE